MVLPTQFLKIPPRVVAVLTLCACMMACGGSGHTTAPAPASSPATPPETLTSRIAVADLQLPIGSLGESYSAFVIVTGNTGAVRWTVAGGALPAGLVLSSSTGEISGTPSLAGVYPLTLAASDSVAMARRDFTLYVSGNGTVYHRYTTPGIYKVRGTVTSASGVSNTSEQVVTVMQ